MDQVFHASVGAHLAVAVVSLGSQDGLAQLHYILCVNEAQVVSDTREGSVLHVGATHAAAHHHVEAEQLARVISDHNKTHVVGVDVEGVVAGDSDSKLEFTR